MDFSIKTYRQITDELLDILADLDREIFEDPYPREKIEREATTKHNFLGLVAFASDKPCAFKAGYEMTASLYYSWIGGVLADCRGLGLARKLMATQHELVQEMGYKTIRTHTENRFREMLVLNIKSGFDIVGVSLGVDAPPRTIVMLEKQLT